MRIVISEILEIDQAQHFIELPLSLSRVLDMTQSESDVFGHRLPRKEAVELINHAHSANTFNFPRRWLDELRKEIEQCGFAATRRSDYGDEFTGSYLQRKVSKDDDFAEAERDILGPQRLISHNPTLRSISLSVETTPDR